MAGFYISDSMNVRKCLSPNGAFQIPAPNYSLHAPYATAGNSGAYSREVFSRPSSANNRLLHVRPYSALDDPHLNEYFRKRFSRIIGPALTGSNHTRPSSAGNSTDSTKYKITVATGDKKHAGTAAKVYIRIRGSKGNVPKRRLKKSRSKRSYYSQGFSRNSTVSCTILGPDVGEIRSIVVEHKGLEEKDGWYLDYVEIKNLATKHKWFFPCSQWLSLFEADCQISRQLFPIKTSNTNYKVTVITGDKKGAGTDANVFVQLFGRMCSTPKLCLKSRTRNTFEQGRTDSFTLKTSCVGPMTKLRIQHDNTGQSPGWYLDRVVIEDLQHPKWTYFFPCGRWLSKDSDDGQICLDLKGNLDPTKSRKHNKYIVTVITGSQKAAGTSADVYLDIFGELGQSGRRRLQNKDADNFCRGMKDVFTFSLASLGRIYKLRVSHNNEGINPDWFLDKIIIDDVAAERVYEFPCKLWLSKTKDGGKTSRELFPLGAADGKVTPYEIRVTTGKKRDAGTNARVYLKMYAGQSGDVESGKVWLEDGSFESGRTDMFNIPLNQMLSPLHHIVIGHDNSGFGPGWFLDSVVINCPVTGIEQWFTCNMWLADSEGDRRIERTLFEDISKRKKRDRASVWKAKVYTTNKRSAGTDSNVYMVLYGSKGKTDELPLDNKSNNFESGAVDEFSLSADDVGLPYKIRIWHDNSGAAAGWHLDKVELENSLTGQHYNFPCQRWLARDEEDHEIIRELPATGSDIKQPLPLMKYDVEVHTGDVRFAGTDANVFLNIFGEYGDIGERPLRESTSSSNKFERNKVDNFVIEAVSLGKLSKIRIGHDGKNAGSGWFLNKVVVKDPLKRKNTTEFVCERWLDSNEDDGQIVREITASGSQFLSTTSYHISVKTGDKTGAGTDANVFLKIFGKQNDTGKLKLRNPENSTGNKFERNRVDLFKIEAADIGPVDPELDEEPEVTKIQLSHDGSGLGSGWFVDDIKIKVPSFGKEYVFAAHRWLDKGEGDGLIDIELEPTDVRDIEITIPYEITVWTGSISGSGTDANVFIQMYGQDGKTEQYMLRDRSDNFETDKKDKFKIEAADVGPLTKIRVGHDNKGFAAGWFLEKILIQRPRTARKRSRSSSIKGAAKFPADRRQKSSRSGSRRSSRFSSPDYSDEAFEDDSNSDSENSSIGTLSDVSDDSDADSQSSYSRSRRSKSRHSLSSKRARSRSRQKQKDQNDEGKIEEYWFVCRKWFDTREGDKKIVRDILPTDSEGRPLAGALQEIQYVVKVYTGDVDGAGTNANVFLNIFGEHGDTGELKLRNSNNRDKFERGQEDIFTFPAGELGKLKKVKIRHDNSGLLSNWYLDRIEIEDPKNKANYLFVCQKWLATGKDDGQISRELPAIDPRLREKLLNQRNSSGNLVSLEEKAAMTTYHVHVVTGKKSGAGTDANVFITLFGEEEDTGVTQLKTSKTNSNKFEEGQTDIFDIEAMDIGELKKLKIWHDNSGFLSAAWYLEKIVVDSPTLGRQWTFPCGKWLAKNKDDGLIERELYPKDMQTELYEKFVKYEVIVHTSNERSAGTDADVFLVIYGKDTQTQRKSLCEYKRQRKKCFNSGSVDRFILEVGRVGMIIGIPNTKLEDVGDTIEKIRIGHDAAGLGSDWLLDKVEIRRLKDNNKGSVTYVFPCGEWLNKAAMVKELVPEKAIEEVIDRKGNIKVNEIAQEKPTKKTYLVNVITGDVRGAGTDANVFVNLFGDKGDCGERPLNDSMTNRNKFEKGNTDKFKVEAADLGKLFKIKIRHDDANLRSDWFLDRVEVIDPEFPNEPVVFHCERWIAKGKDDKKLEKTLYAKGYEGPVSESGSTRSATSRRSSSTDASEPFSSAASRRMSRRDTELHDIPEGPIIPYKITVSTGNEPNCGTKAPVWIRILGPKKKETGTMPLHSPEGFRRGSVVSFNLDGFDVKEVTQIEIGHDGGTPEDSWFVNEIELELPTHGRRYVFSCNSWLAEDRDDGLTKRTFSVQDAQTRAFTTKPKTPYELTIYTGDVENAGTDCDINVTVFGDQGSSEERKIEKMPSMFERGAVDCVQIEIEDIEPFKKLRVGLLTQKAVNRPSWFLEKAELRNMSTDKITRFDCNDWMGSQSSGDNVKFRDLPAIISGRKQLKRNSYKVSVKTSKKFNSGTTAKVYIIMFGEHGDSGEILLEKPGTNREPFDSGQLDVFTLSDVLDLGQLVKLRIWHDDSGLRAGWHLEYVEIEDEKTSNKYMFLCNKWLAKDEDDRQITRDLLCTSNAAIVSPATDRDRIDYELTVNTSSKKNSGTIHNGWVVLVGDRRESKPFVIENSARKKRLRCGETDHFTFTSRYVGKLTHIIVGLVERSDIPSKRIHQAENKWLCQDVTVHDTSDNTKYLFSCNKWLQAETKLVKDDGIVFKVTDVLENRIAALKTAGTVKYEVNVITADVRGGGTDANVFITIYGSLGDTGKRPLTKKMKDLFEAGNTDSFVIESADIGELKKVKIEHDNSGSLLSLFKDSGWMLDRVEVKNLSSGEQKIFPCQKWLDRNKGDKQICRELLPQE